MKRHKGFLVRLPKVRFLYLLVTLLLLFLVFPLLGAESERIGFSFLISGILLTAVYAISEHRIIFILGTFLVIPALLLRWVNYFVDRPDLSVATGGLSAAFLTLVAITILGHVVRDEKVTAEKIRAAVCVYLLIGLIWAMLYFVCSLLIPGSLGSESLQLSDVVYFSYVTLTTLGYGDISPTISIVRALATLEAILGQMFLAILIARLVGLQIAHATQSNSPSSDNSSSRAASAPDGDPSQSPNQSS